MATRLIVLLAAISLTAACARANMAKRAQSELVGMSKTNLLACAGAPRRTAVVEGLEFYTYVSGSRTTIIASQHSGIAEHRYCEVTFVLNDDVVSKVNYSEPTGGIFTKGEECSYVVENCLSQ